MVVPYEKGDAFFIDGVPVTKKELARIKIVRQSPSFPALFDELHYRLGKVGSGRTVPPESYLMRLDALIRGEGEDVTQQILNAFTAGILPRLKEYVP